VSAPASASMTRSLAEGRTRRIKSWTRRRLCRSCLVMNPTETRFRKLRKPLSPGLALRLPSSLLALLGEKSRAGDSAHPLGLDAELAWRARASARQCGASLRLLDDGENPARVVLRICCDEQTRPSRADNSDASTAPVDRARLGRLRQMANGDDRRARSLGNGGKRVERAADVLVSMRVNRTRQERATVTR
jgi:hypothetical protein